nr:hypothetical protein Q903MT_gene3075 [Picea sitchensis]
MEVLGEEGRGELKTKSYSYAGEIPSVSLGLSFLLFGQGCYWLFQIRIKLCVEFVKLPLASLPE